MSEVLQDLSTPALVSTIEANQFASFALWRYWALAQVHDGSDLLWSITSVPVAFFNFVLRAQLEPQNVDATIEAAITRAKSRNVPIVWYVGPATRPSDLGTYLQAHGFTDGGDSPGMAADLTKLNEYLSGPPGLCVVPVDDNEALVHWCRTLRNGFGMPGFLEGSVLDWSAGIGLGERPPRRYLAWMNGEPVATSMSILGAGVAGIYAVATVPEARRQGIGAAITLAPLLQARAEGYRVGILHSSPMGVGVYSQLGFREYCKIRQYVWSSERKAGSKSQK